MWTVANQGWTIVSLLLFGEFSSSGSAQLRLLMLQLSPLSVWKCLLLCTFGSLCSAVAFWTIFKQIFPNVLERVDDDRSLWRSSKKDICTTLQDLGQLGFAVGSLISQLFLSELVYKLLQTMGIDCSNSNVFINSVTLVNACLWMLCTKMRDYNRAVKRIGVVEREDNVKLLEYDQMV